MGGWLLVTALTFSLMGGIIHPYYVAVLAPPLGALIGIAGVTLWRDRARLPARATAAALMVITAGWAFVLLRRTPQWQPWTAWAVLGLGALAAVGLLLADRAPRVLRAGVVAAAVVAGLLGPAGYAVATAAQPHTGAIPSAGPRGQGFGGPGGFGGRGAVGPPGPGSAGSGGTTGPGSTSGHGGSAGGGPAGGTGSSASGPSASGPSASGPSASGPSASGPSASGPSASGFGRGGGGFGGPGGILTSPTPSARVVALLSEGAGSSTWAAAAVGSNTAAGYQLATQLPVMAVGGFNGTDPSPTLEQFQQLVADGRIHWFVGGAGQDGTASGGSDAARRIADWVAQHYTARTVDGVVLYDLSTGAR